MKKLLPCVVAAGLLPAILYAGGPARQECYAIRVYQLQTAMQEARVDSFLRNAFLPALHRHHISGIGVFKPVGNDTAASRRIYVFIPLKSLDQYAGLLPGLAGDRQYQSDGRSYLTAAFDNPPYVRMETILLQAFPDMPQHAAPWCSQGYSADRIYELRSYEGPTEQYFANKVQMFNQGGEIGLFEKLGFHAVFYASVVAGSRMPNLMYMTSFENMAARDAHWKDFGNDPTWKSLSSSPEYQHNVSHIDDIFLHAAPYSEI
ncbi:MAG TPA: NIPSNAP family protein [Puia sp.]|nr:NIPSNAP family protein [Puia sp.]